MYYFRTGVVVGNSFENFRCVFLTIFITFYALCGIFNHVDDIIDLSDTAPKYYEEEWSEYSTLNIETLEF